MSQPIVSVIVPAYNAQNYIEKCVYSILNSSLQEIELIVVDDKSDDKTLEILNGISDSRLKIIAKNERGGYR